MTTQMTKREMEKELGRLAPFHHRVDLPYGLSTHLPDLAHRSIEYTRVANLVEHSFPPLLEACGGSLAGKRVLDVACNCGGFTVAAADHGCESALGIDIVDHYIDQANFIKQARGLSQIDFRVMNIEDLDPGDVGIFDVTFCFGILYHLENPVMAMKRIGAVTGQVMLVDTNVLPVPAGSKPFLSKPLWSMNFPVASSEDDSDSTTSRWRVGERPIQFSPSESAVIALLEAMGFSRVEKIQPRTDRLEKRYYRGRRASFIAVR